MKRKIISFFFILFMILLLSGCSRDGITQKEIINNVQSAQNTDSMTSNTLNPDIISDKQQKNTELDSALRLLYSGGFDTLPVKIGDSKQEVIEKFGKPKNEDYFGSGGKYLNYGKIWILYNQFDKDSVIGIIFFGNSKVYGLEVGKSTEENIKLVFGKPELEGAGKWSSSDSEENGNIDPAQRFLHYGNSKYSIYFYTENTVLKVLEYLKIQ